MAKYDYIFIDESGDPGYVVNPQTGLLLSSELFSMAALHVTDESYGHLVQHVAAFRYLRRLSRELKIPVKKPEFDRFMSPIQDLAMDNESIAASVVYLDKKRYEGPYLRPDSPHGQNPRRFRNYLLRRLLEHHLGNNPLASNHFDLVLDRVEMPRTQQAELWQYLGDNMRIPAPSNITHAASLYVEGLQCVHHIANAFGTTPIGQERHTALRFVSAFDITHE